MAICKTMQSSILSQKKYDFKRSIFIFKFHLVLLYIQYHLKIIQNNSDNTFRIYNTHIKVKQDSNTWICQRLIDFKLFKPVVFVEFCIRLVKLLIGILTDAYNVTSSSKPNRLNEIIVIYVEVVNYVYSEIS